MKIKQLGFKIISAIMVFAVMFSTCATAISATAVGVENSADAGNEKPTFNYVSLGASNVNGYGLRGYVPVDIYSTPLEKEKQNIYGYKTDTPNSYPVLIAERLSENYDVNLSQMAMSSMRAEEIRFLLDESYEGDKYTKWRFYDPTTEEVSYSKNWFYGAGRLEWKLMGREGEPTNVQALETLREAYTTAIAEADLITVDIGMNNFGVYISNQIGSKKPSNPEGYYGNDINKLDPEIAEKYAQGKEFVLRIIDEKMGDLELPMEDLEDIADTLAYALVSFCINFDAVMERIYALNPDVSVVVVSIQNLMEGFDAKVAGIDSRIPFGEIFGAVVNAANTYTAVISKYATTYSYANVTESGHIELFADEVKGYDGDPATLGQDMKDCFDAYDNEIFLQTRIQQILAVQLSQIEVAAGVPLVNIDPSQTDLTDLAGTGFLLFYNGFHYDMSPYMNVSAPAITLYDGTPLKTFLRAERSDIPDSLLEAYDLYRGMLDIAYDVATEVMREGAQVEVIDFASINDGIGDTLLMAMFSTIVDALNEGAGNPDYNFDIYEKYPDGYLNYVAAISGKPIELISTAVAFDVRGGIGNSFFAHPNVQGHIQLCNTIWNAYVNGVTGRDVVIDNLVSFADAISQYLTSHPEYFDALMGLIEKLEEKGREFDKYVYENYSRIDISLDSDSSFVAIGGSDSVQKYENYATLVANYLEVSAKILNQANLRISDLRAIVDAGYEADEYGQAILENVDIEAYLEALSTADVISVSFGIEDFTSFAFLQIFGYISENYGDSVEALTRELGFELGEHKVYEMNWNSFGDLTNADQVSQICKNIYEFLVKCGVPTELELFEGVVVDAADILTYAIESYAYAAISYSYNYGATIDALHNLNPDAEIIVLGAIDIFDGFNVTFGDFVVDIGKITDLFVSAIDLHTLSYVKDAPKTHYVYIGGTETVVESDGIINLLDFMEFDSENKTIGFNADAFCPSVAGHAYIAEQILKAFDPDYDGPKPCKHLYDGCDDTECNKCGLPREAEEHAFSDCTDPSCYKCPYVREAGTHIYDGCLDTKCNLCDVERIATHAYANTCAEECLACGERRLTDHAFGEWITTEEATNKQDGASKRVCSVCGAVETGIIQAYGRLSGGAIAGITCGSVVVAGTGGFSLYWFVIKKKSFADLAGVFANMFAKK